MPKVRRIFETSLELNFVSLREELSSYWQGFLNSDLGLIYQAIPWQELIAVFGLREKSSGKKPIFSPQGKLGLMFLKHYACCSDQRLLEQLNGNIHYQLFCGLMIDPLKPLTRRQLVSEIRGELAAKLPIEDAQAVLAHYWKPYLSETENLLVDATCYESEVRYPSDLKLLWESVSWLEVKIRQLSKLLKQPMIRSKYKKWALRYGIYRRKRNPRKKQTHSLKGGLLRLMEKFLNRMDQIGKDFPLAIEPKDLSWLVVIRKVYLQQYHLFKSDQKPSGRIVSLAKPYLRPIVRGKEIKLVEFGAKVNKIQIDGINFIEHISFDAFHEGKRLEQSIFLGRKLTGKVKRIGADQIYATNANRSYCKSQGIFADFRPKGRKGKFEDQNKVLRKAITKERASRLEGSFGNEKNHYHLRTIKARTKKNEILWIFFGIHTANALQIGRRITEQAFKKAA